jgi:hypothetical protein
MHCLWVAIVTALVGAVAPAGVTSVSAASDGTRAEGTRRQEGVAVRNTTKQGSRVPERVVRMPMQIVRMPMLIVRLPMNTGTTAPVPMGIPPEDFPHNPNKNGVAQGAQRTLRPDRNSVRNADTVQKRANLDHANGTRRVSIERAPDLRVIVFKDAMRDALGKLSRRTRIDEFQRAQERARQMEGSGCAGGRCGSPTGGDFSMVPAAEAYDPALDIEAEARAAKEASVERPPEDPVERACWHARAGRWLDAIATLEVHLESNPEDVDAARTLAVLILLSTDAAEGAELLVAVYRADPTLGERPLELEPMGLDRRSAERVWEAARTRAARRPTAAALFAAGVVARAVGNQKGSDRFMERAADAGLDPMIVAAFDSTRPRASAR